MDSSVFSSSNRAIALLQNWLAEQISADAQSWLQSKSELIAQGANKRVFFTTFSSVPRYTGKNDLKIPPEDFATIEEIRPGWSPGHWSVDQAARTILVLSVPQDNPEQYLSTLEQVFQAADVGELVALYQALPLLPYSEQFRKRAAEGIRSNMTAVFDAVALKNPYPAQYFDNTAWNQLVLKALFVGSPLAPIVGLDSRTNPQLTRMLIDYAHERWAAGRTVSPELWRAVGKIDNSANITDLERVLAISATEQQAAAALACASSPLPEAKALLNNYPDLQAAVESRRLTWSSFNQL